MSRQEVRTLRLIAEDITNSKGGTPRIAGLSVTELEFLDAVIAGTGAASKAMVLDSGGDFIMPSTGLFGMSRGTLAAAGSTAADAAVITQQITAVTASDGTKAVALPAAAVAIGPLLVINTVLTTGTTLPVFPVNGGDDNINGEAEDAAFTMGPGRAAWFIPVSATQWYVADASGVTSTKAEASILTGVTATAAELNYVDLTGAVGTQEASKAVVADANINTGVSKVTELHIGATGSETQIQLVRNPGNMASAYIDFNVAGEAAMSVTIDSVVYQEADAEDLPNGVWTNGASAANSATSLIAAINGDTRAGVPFTAVADVTGDGVWLFWDAVGTAGNVTITTTSASNCTVQNSTGGAAAAIKQVLTIVHTINTQALLSGVTEIPVPFTPTKVIVNAYDASGTPIFFTDTVTIGTTPDRIKITTAGGTTLADTNVVHLTVFE